MNRRELFAGVGAAAFVTGFAGDTWADTKPITPSLPISSPRQTLLLNTGWRFYEGDFPLPPLIGHDAAYNAAKAGAARGAASPSFDDSEWQTVTVPHDFASFQPISEADNANIDQGFRKRGVGWYRNSLKFNESDRGKHIELQIEGAATYATVWFNGTLVDRNWSGYSSSYIDLTPYVTFGDVYNSLVVRVDATAMEGWWYEGAGLYRDVRIVKRNPVHIVTDGVFAHPVKEGDTWRVPVEVTINNSGKTAREVVVFTQIWDDKPLGGVAPGASTRVTIAPLSSMTVHMSIDALFRVPELWSPENPHLYQVETSLAVGDMSKDIEYVTLDEVTTNCGFRTQRFDAKTGFYLNDKRVKIKGVCLHQDHAGVGTAVPEGIIDYRLRRLKSTGCNAIRFSHNAQNKALMDACDRHGFLVMAENRQFNPSSDYMAQLEWLVRRDRNHPSIYLWSVFNEEPMQGTEAGYEMVRRMSAVVKSLDTTRPVTAAMNDGLFTPLNVSHAVDVVGINYQQNQYDPFHAAHPDKPMFSSEDTSAFMTRGEYTTDMAKGISASFDDDAAPWGETHRAAWKAINERDFVAGTFVWTGFDYHGEPTPHIKYPSNSSVFGIMDLCGFDKTAVHIHRAQWVRDRPVVGLAPHWNWKSGENVHVMACANTEEVELFVNSKSAGKQKTDSYEMNHWHVPFAPGRIEARGLNGGKVVAKAVVETVGEPVALRLTADRTGMVNDGIDAQPIKVEAIDARGRTHPFAKQMVTFAIEDGAIIGLGNGDPTCVEAEKGDKRSLFNGLAQVIVQSLPQQAGTLRLRATADGLKAAVIEVPVGNVPPVPAQVTAPSVQILNSWFASPESETGIDPGAPRDGKWNWFRPGGELRPPLKAAGFVLCETTFTPFARVQKAGGVLEFLSVTGACQVFIDGQAVGSKGAAAAGSLQVPIAAKAGERRVAVLFKVVEGEAFGFGGVVRARV